MEFIAASSHDRRFPRYSGYVALELEACKDLGILKNAIQRMSLIANFSTQIPVTSPK
jgi:hypothetical protein